MSHRSSWGIFRLLLLFSMYMNHFIEVFSYLADPLPRASECLKSSLGQNRKFKRICGKSFFFITSMLKWKKWKFHQTELRWVIFLMSPDIRTSLSAFLMVLLAVLLVDKSMYDIGLIHPKSSAAQKNPLLIAQCGSALLSSSNNKVS